MHRKVAWHLYRRTVYVIVKKGGNFHVTPIQRVTCRHDGEKVVRLNGFIYKLYSAERLAKFYWSKVGTFGRRKIREGSPRFLLGEKQLSEKDMKHPFVKKWERPIGPYM